IYLNQAGAPEFDCVCIEYNDILVDRTIAKATRAACLAMLTKCEDPSYPKWQEMRWEASPIPPEHMPGRRDVVMETVITSPSPYIDLHAVRRRGGDPLELLSANTRHQVRRSIRLYEAMGKVSIDRSTTIREGCAWLEALQQLHQARWTSRGKSGAFARPFFGRFLRQLYVRGFEARVVDILRVYAGHHELGYLYNFVYRDRVSNYQGGFRFGPDSRYKPGLLA